MKKEKFLSLKWFKETIEKSVDKTIAKRVDDILSKPTEVAVETDGKLYTSLKLIGDVLVVVLNDGTILHKNPAVRGDYEAVKQATDRNELSHILGCPEIREERKVEEAKEAKDTHIKQGIQFLTSLKEFSLVGECVYMKGIPRSMPILLIEGFMEIIGKYSALGEGWKKKLRQDEEFNSLKKFWLKCCLNPNARSAEDLYDFLHHHNFKLDRHGNFYAYRRVVSRENENKALVEFVSNAYTKVRAVWKKSTDNYRVVKCANDCYELQKNTDPLEGDIRIEGNLTTLYKHLPDYQSNSYTSAHTGLEDYRIGSVISMPRFEGNDNNQVSCSRGFHAASKAYDYSGFGNIPILVIINPMDVLAVPRGEVGKLRTCRWFFATTLPEDEKYILDDIDYSVLELGDIFEEQCNINLDEYVHNSFAEEVKRHTFSIPAISYQDIYKIVQTLDDMSLILDNRVKEEV